MRCRVKVTGAGIVGYEGEGGLEHPVPRGEYTLTKSDGRYRLTGPSGDYFIIAPDGIEADGYLDQKLEDRTFQIIEEERP